MLEATGPQPSARGLLLGRTLALVLCCLARAGSRVPGDVRDAGEVGGVRLGEREVTQHFYCVVTEWPGVLPGASEVSVIYCVCRTW